MTHAAKHFDSPGAQHHGQLRRQLPRGRRVPAMAEGRVLHSRDKRHWARELRTELSAGKNRAWHESCCAVCMFDKPEQYAVVLSDIHIGDNAPTCWYQARVHFPYLESVLAWAVAKRASVREVISWATRSTSGPTNRRGSLP